jgi:hypothetical protein
MAFDVFKSYPHLTCLEMFSPSGIEPDILRDRWQRLMDRCPNIKSLEMYIPWDIVSNWNFQSSLRKLTIWVPNEFAFDSTLAQVKRGPFVNFVDSSPCQEYGDPIICPFSKSALERMW